MRCVDRGRLLVLAAALAAALGLVLSGCRAPSPGGPELNAVRALLTTDPLSLTIVGKGDRYSAMVGWLLTDPLVQYDAGLVLRPRLAESWEVSADGLSVKFHLRRGVRWHDGRPVTAHDVVFTVRKIQEPATEARSFLPQLASVVSVEALDDTTVLARLREPHADFLEAWLVPILPAHAAGADEDFLTGEFSRHPIGCGPFRFVEHRPGERLVLEANPDYWDGPPRIDRLVFRIFPDERTGYQALLGGEIDLMPATPDIWREAQRSPRAAHLERLVYYRLNVWYVGWNQDGSNPFFTDPRVRRAMVLALDRQKLSDKLLSGLARPGATTYHPDSPWTDPSIGPWPYDPQAARALLGEAGWLDGDGDGVRERDGRPFEFTLLIATSPQEIVSRMAAWIQQSLAEIGVRMQIETIEGRTFRARVREHRFEAMMTGLTFDPMPDQYEIYHSTMRDDGYNYVSLADPEVDRLLERGRRAFDPEARLRIYHTLQRRLHELEPLTCLFNFASPVLHDRRLQNVEPSPLDIWRITPGPRAWYWAEAGAGG